MPKKHRGLRQLYRELMEEVRARKGVSIVFFTLRAIVLATLVLSFLRGNYENVFLCLLTLLLFLIPAFINRRLNIQLPDTLEIIILCFIFAAEILGEINAYYVKYDFWDTMLHTMNGFLAAAIGFSLVDVYEYIREDTNDAQETPGTATALWRTDGGDTRAQGRFHRLFHAAHHCAGDAGAAIFAREL